MSWGNSNSNGGTADWETQGAPAIEEPTVTDTNNAAPAGEPTENPEAPASEGPTKGATAEWQAHPETRYNYEEYGIRDGEYDGNARVYHWDGEEGDIGPEFPELEVEIFGPPDQRGEAFGPEIGA